MEDVKVKQIHEKILNSLGIDLRTEPIPFLAYYDGKILIDEIDLEDLWYLIDSGNKPNSIMIEDPKEYEKILQKYKNRVLQNEK